MKVVLTAVLIFSTLQGFSQFSLQELIGYLKKTNDVIDESMDKKGFVFNGSKIASDSSKSALWVKNNDIFAIRMEPDTVSIMNPGLGYIGYTDVLKHEILFITKRKSFYDFTLQEVKNTSFKRIGSSIVENTLTIKYVNSKYYVLLNKVVKDDEVTYGVIVVDKEYIIGESHVE